METKGHEISLNPQKKSRTPALIERISVTQKEVGYVQQTAQSVAEFSLRRLMSTWVDDRSGKSIATPIISLDALNRLPILSLHRSLFLHALNGQLYAFSGGQLHHGDAIYPLWIELMLAGNGLRRMTADTAQYAERLMKLLGSVDPEAIASRYIDDPWKSYRLGLFSLSSALMSTPHNDRENELALRVQLATSILSDETIAKLERIAPTGSNARISLISSAIAYAIKQKQQVPAVLFNELEDWVLKMKGQAISSENASLIAQAINAINLYLLANAKIDEIATNMDFLLSLVTPRIVDMSRRAHIEGNAYYQCSILSRRRKDRTDEINSLMQAMKLDRHFATLYYRAAQVLHDLGDARAETFYEMALALSPLDYPVANDYGCWLTDSGQKEKFDSWAILCQALYPEQFVINAEENIQ